MENKRMNHSRILVQGISMDLAYGIEISIQIKEYKIKYKPISQ